MNRSIPEMLRHAAASVFHYFKIELERETVTVGEFSLALEKVLRHLGYTIHAGESGTRSRHPRNRSRPARARIRRQPGTFFLPAPARRTCATSSASRRASLRFRGLRGCVKQLAGARRWSPRCEQIAGSDRGFLRGCLTAETGAKRVRAGGGIDFEV